MAEARPDTTQPIDPANYLKSQGCILHQPEKKEKIPEINDETLARLFPILPEEDRLLCLQALENFLTKFPITLPEELKQFGQTGKYTTWRKELPKSVRRFYDEHCSLRGGNISPVLTSLESLACATTNGEICQQFYKIWEDLSQEYYGQKENLGDEEKISLSNKVSQGVHQALTLIAFQQFPQPA